MTDRRSSIINPSIISPVASNKKVGFRPPMSFDLIEYRLFPRKKSMERNY